MFQRQQAAELGSFSHGVLALESRTEETGYWNLPPQLREATEARVCVQVFNSLHGGLERPSCEAVKVKPGCLGDLKMMGMPESWGTCGGELLTGSGNSQRERRAVVTRAERTWRSEECFNI